jgi:K+-sensing histidine kinase KdpD
VLLTGAALAASLVLRRIIPPTFLLFAASVALATRFGGVGPGLVASALAAVAIDWFFLEPVSAVGLSHPAELIYLAVFVAVALVIGGTTEQLRRAHASQEARAEQLEQLNVELEQQMEEVQTLSEHLQESNDALAKAHAAAERVAARAVRLQEVTAALSDARTVAQVAEVVLEQGLDAVQAARGCLFSQDGHRRALVAARGYSADAEAQLRAIAEDDGLPVAHALRLSEAVWLRTPDDSRRRFPEFARWVHLNGLTPIHVAVPLTHRGEAVGALTLDFGEFAASGTEDEAFILLLAQAAADALARARSYDEEREARGLAETVARAREDVLAVVAHDLRNPLNLMDSTAQILLELDPPAAKRLELLAVQRRAARQMNRLIGDLLDAVRLQAGRLSLELRMVDVGEILHQAEEMFRFQSGQRHIRLETASPPHPVHVWADPERTLQVLGNLLGNALKFTGERGIVTLAARPDGGRVVFMVADTGPGIPPDNIERLFDRFWQARRTDRRGVGLGLAIAKAIVEAHGGRIWVESAPGHGSTFSFTLPTAAADSNSIPTGDALPVADVRTRTPAGAPSPLRVDGASLS